MTFGVDASCKASSQCTASKGVLVSGLCSDAGDVVCCAPDLCTRALGDASKCIAQSAMCDGIIVAGYCGGQTKCCSPRTDTSPAAAFLRVEGDAVVGWACDVDAGGALVDSQIYLNAPAGASPTTPATSLLARWFGRARVSPLRTRISHWSAIILRSPDCLREAASADYLAGADVSMCGCPSGDCRIGCARCEHCWRVCSRARALRQQISCALFAIERCATAAAGACAEQQPRVLGYELFAGMSVKLYGYVM